MSYAQENIRPRRRRLVRLGARARELEKRRRSPAGASRSPVLALVILLIPIKRYRLPVELPFNLEVYRLLLLGLFGVVR